MSKTVSTKKTNTIFLAIVLIAGVITIASPSSVFSQEYDGYANEYNWHEQYEYKPEMRYNEPTYVQEYDGYANEYNSYDKSKYQPEMKYAEEEVIPIAIIK